ncbi:MAG: hypothetical protein M3511_01505 [Deinococcota bacterium]|nr:hypothetical protein [Deinococcota bacterium]
MSPLLIPPWLRRTLDQLYTFTFWRRFFQLNLGLMTFGLGLALMLRAGIGLDPWSVFHEGVSVRTGLSFGRVTQLTGVALIVASYTVLRVKPGLGTVLNMLVVGPWVNLFRSQTWLPSAESWALGTLQFMLGVALLGLASGLYIAAKFGAGPRDGFVLGLSLSFKRSIRLTRAATELGVLLTGFALGGPPGLGTVLFALTIGYFMQVSLRLFGYHHWGPLKPGPATD